jgi:hypothetical protein
MKRIKLFMVFFLFSLASFSEVEQLLGVNTHEDGITFQVESNGCTFKKDFQFDVKEKLQELSPLLPAMESNYYITVIRNKTDTCKASVPYGTQIFMSYSALGIHHGKFHVINPVGGKKFVFAK